MNMLSLRGIIDKRTKSWHKYKDRIMANPDLTIKEVFGNDPEYIENREKYRTDVEWAHSILTFHQYAASY